jgi:hypothetical protein
LTALSDRVPFSRQTNPGCVQGEMLPLPFIPGAGFKKPLPQVGNPIRYLKLEEPVTFNVSWGSMQEKPEVAFGSFFAILVPILSFK